MHSRVRPLSLAVCLLTGAAAPAAPLCTSAAAALPAPDPAVESLITLMRTSLVEGRDADQDALLRGMRRLRDPGLRALFAQCAAADSPLLRIHGILGLAELERPPQVDILLVKRLPETREQIVVLGEAIRAGMLGKEHLEDVARWPDLDPALTILILGRLHRAGRSVDPADFSPFLDSDDSAAAVLAALERRELLPDAPAARGDELLAALLTAEPGPDQIEQAVMVLAYIRRERLTRCSAFARAALAAAFSSENNGQTSGLADTLRFEALRTLMAIAPDDPAVLDVFADRYRAADALGRSRLALAALEAAIERPMLSHDAPTVPVAYFNLIRGEPTEPDDRLLAAIAGAGAAAARRFPQGAGETIADLVALGHIPTVDWALRAAAACSPDDAQHVRLAVISAAAEHGRARPALYDAAAFAAAQVADVDPALLNAPLARAAAAEDVSMQRALLAGALQSTNPAAAALASPPMPAHGDGTTTWPDPVAAGLATILQARHRDLAADSDAETDAAFHALASIALSQTAAGGGREGGHSAMPDVFRLQAAWLALRCRGQQRIALARMLAEPAR